ncbi:MAG: hypothetical protein JNL11_06890 [Bdellovibrionaceae bacterium]|nr:hypothetical protein [Pseudobdellovibrionaceae bacterium]
MNIKSVLNPNAINTVKNVERAERTIQSDSTHDRDPNSHPGYEQNQKNNQPLSEDEIQQALEHLEKLPFVKEHGWIIELATENNLRFVLVKDATGQLIRRFPESDLRTLPVDLDDKKGQLLKKTA